MGADGAGGLRDLSNGKARVVPAMGLLGWPAHTQFFVDIDWRGETRTKNTPLWVEVLNPPSDDQDGDEQMLATIVFSEIMEDTLYATRLPEPSEFWSDLEWEARVFHSVRTQLGTDRSQASHGSPPNTMGFREVAQGNAPLRAFRSPRRRARPLVAALGPGLSRANRSGSGRS